MWSNSASSKLLAAFLFTCISLPTYACEICPSQAGQTLKNVDVFDGTPEEMATLVPDEGDEKTGFWKLGYVYEAGRIVTVRCKYSGGATQDVPLPEKVSKCSYQIDAKKVLSLRCD